LTFPTPSALTPRRLKKVGIGNRRRTEIAYVPLGSIGSTVVLAMGVEVGSSGCASVGVISELADSISCYSDRRQVFISLLDVEAPLGVGVEVLDLSVSDVSPPLQEQHEIFIERDEHDASVPMNRISS
jgi:hypothetical protein